MAKSQWAKIARRNKERLRLIAQEAYSEMAGTIIVRSPVDSGLFRNNWFSSIGTPATKVTAKKAINGFGEKGGARFTDFLHVSTSFDIGDQLLMVNNLPYARRLEYGHSQKMAPHGMVRVSVAQWPFLVAKIARKIK